MRVDVMVCCKSYLSVSLLCITYPPPPPEEPVPVITWEAGKKNLMSSKIGGEKKIENIIHAFYKIKTNDQESPRKKNPYMRAIAILRLIGFLNNLDCIICYLEQGNSQKVQN